MNFEGTGDKQLTLPAIRSCKALIRSCMILWIWCWHRKLSNLLKLGKWISRNLQFITFIIYILPCAVALWDDAFRRSSSVE
ncbi:hypothetical protein BD408DRAFT_425008 [Parasitella parasitica]|nr:hypothetical protein BD408DRAFT_425008 [Parasitella parasitica]